MPLKKFTRQIEKFVSKPFKKRRRRSPSPPQPPPPPPTPKPPSPITPVETMLSPPPPPPELRRPSIHLPFIFPQTQSAVLPDPSLFFAPHLLFSPLPTNSFFQNFTLKHGDQPEYVHPYIVKSSLSSLTVCYPPLFSNSAFTYQVFNADLTISALNNPNPDASHIISSFDDLSVTLDLPSSNLRFLLVRGSPFLTCSSIGSVALSISTIHAIVYFCSNSSRSKYTIKLNNNQTWEVEERCGFRTINGGGEAVDKGGGVDEIDVVVINSFSR